MRRDKSVQDPIFVLFFSMISDHDVGGAVKAAPKKSSKHLKCSLIQIIWILLLPPFILCSFHCSSTFPPTVVQKKYKKVLWKDKDLAK